MHTTSVDSALCIETISTVACGVFGVRLTVFICNSAFSCMSPATHASASVKGKVTGSGFPRKCGGRWVPYLCQDHSGSVAGVTEAGHARKI